MQKVTIIGNICKDPEVTNGVAKFSVAVNEKFKTKSGEQKETTEFFNCVMFGKSADVAENYFTKGMKIYLEGKQSTNEHEGKRYTSLIVNQFEFLGGGRQAEKKDNKLTEEQAFEDDMSIPF